MKHIRTKEEFENLIANNNYVIIDFYASWCGPCKMLTPIIEEIEVEKSNITIVKVDVDDAQELAEMFAISSIPTLAYIKNQELALRKVGFESKKGILENIKTIYE